MSSVVLAACASAPTRGMPVTGSVSMASPAVPVPAGARCPAPGGAFTSGHARVFGAITLPCLRPGPAVSLDRLGGAKPVLVNVWASWCVPCQREMPRLQRAARLAEGRLLVIGVDTLDTTGSARSFLRAVGATYPQLVDRSGATRTAVHAVGLPDTLVLDPTGAVIFRKLGELTAGDLTSVLRRVGIAVAPAQLDGTAA